MSDGGYCPGIGDRSRERIPEGRGNLGAAVPAMTGDLLDTVCFIAGIGILLYLAVVK